MDNDKLHEAVEAAAPAVTEPTRDALHAETLAMLEKEALDYARSADGPVANTTDANDAAMFAHAAACVKRVGELEAEVERLRAKAAIVDAMERALVHAKTCETCFRYGVDECVTGATYAAATREGTDAN